LTFGCSYDQDPVTANAGNTHIPESRAAGNNQYFFFITFPSISISECRAPITALPVRD
jgi:hypothetical protein